MKEFKDLIQALVAVATAKERGDHERLQEAEEDFYDCLGRIADTFGNILDIRHLIVQAVVTGRINGGELRGILNHLSTRGELWDGPVTANLQCPSQFQNIGKRGAGVPTSLHLRGFRVRVWIK